MKFTDLSILFFLRNFQNSNSNIAYLLWKLEQTHHYLLNTKISCVYITVRVCSKLEMILSNLKLEWV